MGNLPENLGRAEEWLKTYNNFYVDIDARLSELGRQPYSARKFIIEWQGRVLFGTDGNAMSEPLDTMYDLHWWFLETNDEHFDIAKSHKFQARWSVDGLYLPDEVLEKIYQTNASGSFPNLGSRSSRLPLRASRGRTAESAGAIAGFIPVFRSSA